MREEMTVEKVAESAGATAEVDVIVGTLGKALGSYGAYVLCDATMAKYLINTARTLIFSTALSPPAVAAAMAALELLREQPRRVEKLQRNAAVLRESLSESGVPVEPGETPIVSASPMGRYYAGNRLRYKRTDGSHRRISS